ncbi:phospholipase A [Sulfurimonas sp. SAG-AH-194-L11]|nr:phospholipase A [Sulfurimonas sp. SAG-AH-194-L11]MDF1876204.1 phospholipase A [Sulfurimonas sp. SAG-AH-194-L11]
MKLLLLFFLLLSLNLNATAIDKLAPLIQAQAFFNNDEYEKAFAILLKCTEKSQNSEAAYKLGWMYQNAKGVAQNHKEAAIWYKKAAQWEVAKTNRKKLYQTIFSNMSPLSDDDSSQTALKLISGKFALRAYEPNYLMVSYSDTIPKGDIKYESRKPIINSNVERYLPLELQYQISLRADYVTDWFGASQIWSAAYTQTSFWQIFLNSSPFRETNYKPELFVTFPLLHKADIVGLKGVVFGYKHSSNGQPVTDGNRTRPDGPIEGSRSRSWNRLYLKTYFQWGNFFSTLNVWHRLAEDKISDDNPDIEEYYGQGSVELTYIHKKLLLSAKVNPSIKKGVASAEVSMSYPTLVSEDVYFYLQAFSGYGSSLIDYDQKITKVGFGISISR